MGKVGMSIPIKVVDTLGKQETIRLMRKLVLDGRTPLNFVFEDEEYIQFKYHKLTNGQDTEHVHLTCTKDEFING